MKIFQFIKIVSCVFLVLSCGLSKTSLKESLANAPTEDLKKNGSTIFKDLLNQNVDKKIPIENPDAAAMINPKKIDSVYAILKQDKEIILDYKDRSLYEALLYKNLKDTTYLSNMFIKTPTDGSVKSFQFNVLKDDEVFYSIENLKGNEIEEISILEGETFRYVKQKFPKKTKKEGVIKILNDNTLTLNIDNSSFLKNKGIFSSDLKITLKKISPLKIKYEEIIDSIATTIKQIEVVNDTLFQSSYSEAIELAPLLDITEKNQIVFPIDINPEGKELVGWGYWVSLNPYNTLDWFSDQDNDMINFANQEFFNTDNKVVLQNSENENIRLKINNISLDVRTLNYSGNYAFYLSDQKIIKPHRRAEVVLTNLSNLYTYPIKLGVVSVFFKAKEVETTEEIFTEKKIIKLTLLENE